MQEGGRLGDVGFALGYLGSLLGFVNHFGAVSGPMQAYVVGAGGHSPPLLVRLTWVLAGLTPVGIAGATSKASRGRAMLALAMGSPGCAYCLTDPRGFVGSAPVHALSGALFGLAWKVIGCALLRSG